MMKQCPLCNELLFDDGWIDHFRLSKEPKHKEIWNDVITFEIMIDDVTDSELIKVLREKYLVKG